jgi:hypothetical protein
MRWRRRASTSTDGTARRFSRRQLELAVAVVVVLSAAGVGYAEWIVGQQPDPSALGHLAVQGPPSGFEAKAAQRAPVPSSDIVFSEEKTAVRSTPGNAGQFSVTWKGDAKHKTAIAELLVTVAPTEADATTVRSQAATQYLSAKKLAADGYKVTGSFSVPGVPDARAVALTSSSSTLKTAAIVFRYDRAVVVDFVEEPSAAPSSTAVHLAQSEFRLLEPGLPALTLVETTYPLVASVAFWGITVALLALAVVAPGAFRRARQRRRTRLELAHRRERLARGRKVVTRRATPGRRTVRVRR